MNRPNGPVRKIRGNCQKCDYSHLFKVIRTGAIYCSNCNHEQVAKNWTSALYNHNR